MGKFIKKAEKVELKTEGNEFKDIGLEEASTLFLDYRGCMIPEDLDEKIKLLKSQVIYAMFTLHEEWFILHSMYRVAQIH